MDKFSPRFSKSSRRNSHEEEIDKSPPLKRMQGLRKADAGGKHKSGARGLLHGARGTKGTKESASRSSSKPEIEAKLGIDNFIVDKNKQKMLREQEKQK